MISLLNGGVSGPQLLALMIGPADCRGATRDRKSTRLNSSHGYNSYAAFCLKENWCGRHAFLTLIVVPSRVLLGRDLRFIMASRTRVHDLRRGAVLNHLLRVVPRLPRQDAV